MEKKYESDMTPKEKRQLELEKLKKMTFPQKLEYLWTYYKFVLVIVLFAAIGISVGGHIFQGLTEKNLLSVAVMDAHYEKEDKVEELRADLLALLGTGDKHEVVGVDVSLRSGDDYGASMKRTTVLAAGTVDVLICDQSTYEMYAGEGAFGSWEEILGEQAGAYAKWLDGDKLLLTDSSRWESYGLTEYEPIYAVAMAGSENTENIKKFADYIIG